MKENVLNFYKTLESFTRKHKPELLVGIGIAGLTIAGIGAVLVTPKAMKAVDEEIEKKNEELTKLIDVLREDAGKLRSQSGTSKADTENLIKQREEFEKISAELRILEREKTEEREKLSGEIARLTERKESMSQDLENISNRLYEEYELTRREAEELNIEIEDVGEARKRLNELYLSEKNLNFQKLKGLVLLTSALLKNTVKFLNVMNLCTFRLVTLKNRKRNLSN